MFKGNKSMSFPGIISSHMMYIILVSFKWKGTLQRIFFGYQKAKRSKVYFEVFFTCLMCERKSRNEFILPL